MPPAHVRALKTRSPKKPEPLARRSGDDSPQFDDEIDLGAEALDDTAARRRALCGNQPLVWGVLTKLQNSLSQSNRSRFG